jgi:hypothetical protein
VLCLYDDLYEPPTTIEVIFYLVCYIESKFSIYLFKKESETKGIYDDSD